MYHSKFPRIHLIQTVSILLRECVGNLVRLHSSSHPAKNLQLAGALSGPNIFKQICDLMLQYLKIIKEKLET